MSFVKYAVPLLAVAGQALAQCSATTTTLQSQGDASALSACTTFTGSVAFATGTSGDITLDGVQVITGSLEVNDAVGMTSFSAPALGSIGGDLQMSDLSVLTSVNFPRLASLANLNLTTLPRLITATFTTGIQSANSVSIVNTQLSTLDGLNPPRVGAISIQQNSFLTGFTMTANTTSNITVTSNSASNFDLAFPNLVRAYGIVVNSATTLTAPALQTVNGTVSVNANGFTDLAFPNMTSAGGLDIESNRYLSNLSFPALATVGAQGINIISNPALTGTIAFPVLTLDAGNIKIVGAFSAVSVPVLKHVTGASNITSSANITATCATFTGSGAGQLGGGPGGVIGGTNYCKGASGSTSTGTSSGSSSSSTAKSAAGSLAAPFTSVLTGFAIVGALFAMC